MLITRSKIPIYIGKFINDMGNTIMWHFVRNAYYKIQNTYIYIGKFFNDIYGKYNYVAFGTGVMF